MVSNGENVVQKIGVLELKKKKETWKAREPATAPFTRSCQLGQRTFLAVCESICLQSFTACNIDHCSCSRPHFIRSSSLPSETATSPPPAAGTIDFRTVNILSNRSRSCLSFCQPTDWAHGLDAPTLRPRGAARLLIILGQVTRSWATVFPPCSLPWESRGTTERAPTKAGPGHIQLHSHTPQLAQAVSSSDSLSASLPAPARLPLLPGPGSPGVLGAF